MHENNNITIGQLEKLSINAWPALENVEYDGWILRFSEGFTKRSNSVNLINKSTLDYATKIEYCENMYRSKGLPVCFKIADKISYSELENMLTTRGYRYEDNISMQLMPLNRPFNMDTHHMVISEVTDENWVEKCANMFEINPSHHHAFRQIINKVSLPKCLVSLVKEGETIGCGLGILEEKYLGLFDIVIHKAHRGKGYGRVLVENILNWGKNRGAEFGYLQVFVNNLAANRLYSGIGFKEIYTYWYLLKA